MLCLSMCRARCVAHDAGVRRALRRQRDDHVFQELDAIFGADRAVADELPEALARDATLAEGGDAMGGTVPAASTAEKSRCVAAGASLRELN